MAALDLTTGLNNYQFPNFSGNTLDDQTLSADNYSNGLLGGSSPLSNQSGLFGLSNNTLSGIGTGLSGLAALGNLYNAFQANSLAKKQFNYTKGVTDTNLANQIQSYNTDLSDRENARASVEGLTQNQVNQYLAKNSLSRSS